MTVLNGSPLASADPLCRLDAKELVQGYAAGQFSPVDVAQAVLRRAEDVQGSFNAFTSLDHDGALKAARASEARWHSAQPLSPIDGVPTTIKDIVLVRGWSTRFGSLTTEITPAAEDSPPVTGLRAAGAVLVGMTTMPEFGWKALTDNRAQGATLNPFDRTLTPGGSSGGAAVAAATGAAVLHLGTDGGGSIRIPAAFCGIAGLKPTYGRVAAYPASAFAAVAHIGPMARRVSDLVAMLGAMSGNDPRDWAQGPALLPPLETVSRQLEGLKVGLWRGMPGGSEIDRGPASATQNAVEALARAGARIVEMELPSADLLSIFRVFWRSGAAFRLSKIDVALHDRIDPGFLAIAEAGARYSAADLLRAGEARATFGRAMDALMEEHDVILSPAVAVSPFPIGLEVPPDARFAAWDEWAAFSFPINLSQQPAVVVPWGKDAAGLPSAIQLIGRRGRDSDLLAVAEAVEHLASL